jgi:uncharacterized protein (TIGR03083 family)
MREDDLRRFVAAHRGVYDGVRDAVSGLSEQGWSNPTGCPGWDVKDQLAHIIGVERQMLGDDPDDVEVPDRPYLRNDFGRAVEPAVEARRGRPPEALVEEAETVFARRIEALEALEPDALDEPMAGAAGLTMKGSQMLRPRVFDMVCHEHDIRRAVGHRGGVEGPHVDLSVEQVVRGWARSLSASHSGVLEVAVEGRDPVRIDLDDGTIHRDASGPEPTATIHLDVGDLLALAGGRSDAPSLAGLRIDGDRTWTVQVLAEPGMTP